MSDPKQVDGLCHILADIICEGTPKAGESACSDGLGYGNNGRAALITRGLVEISRIALKLGANPLTLSGLAGMGDLVLTCTGTFFCALQISRDLPVCCLSP